jgi:hypothetical protein
MNTAKITKFGGLLTGSNNPPFNTARSILNMGLHRELQAAQLTAGYAVHEVSAVPAARHKVSSLVWGRPHQFYVPNFGGRNVTLQAATYRKLDYVDGDSFVDRWGIFAKPHFQNIIADFRSSTFEAAGAGASTQGWTSAGNHSFTGSTTDFRSGAASLRVTATGAGDGTANYITLAGTTPTIGQHYRIVLYVRRDGVLNGQILNVSFGGKTYTTALDMVGTPGADTGLSPPFQFDVIATTTDPIRIWFSADSYNTIFFVDDVSIESWQDTWRELTEMYILSAIAVTTDEIQIAQGGGGDDDIMAVDTGQDIFNTMYLKGFAVIPSLDANYANGYGQMVSGVRRNGSDLFLISSGGDWQGITAGDKIFVMRNLVTRELTDTTPAVLPTTPTSIYFDGVRGEVRVTSGNGESDFALAIGFTDKKWRWAFATASNEQPKVLSLTTGLYCEAATLQQYERTVYFEDFGAAGSAFEAGDGLPEGEWEMGVSIVTDDGQESQLMQNTTDNFPATNTAGQQIKYSLHINYGALPKRAQLIRVYARKDGLEWLWVEDISLWVGAGTSIEQFDIQLPSDPYHAVDTNLWIKTVEYKIGGEKWRNAIDSYLSLTGHQHDAHLDIVYSRAATVGNTRFIVASRRPNMSDLNLPWDYKPNLLYESAQHGFGVPQYDAYPADLPVDVEFNDGDIVRAIAPLGDRILVLKSHALVLLIPDGNGGYNRDVLTRLVGIAAADSLVVFDDTAFWADYTGIYSYSPTSGLKMLSLKFIEEYRILSATVKEAAVAAIDPFYRRIHFAVNSKEYVYSLDLDDWTIDTKTDQPTIMVQGVLDKYLFLDAGSSEIYKASDTALFKGLDFLFHWETNKFTLSQEHDNPMPNALRGNYDLLPRTVYIEATSTVALTVEVWLNEDVAASFTGTYPANAKRFKFRMPLGLRCNGVRIKISGTTSGTSNVALREIALGYHIVPLHGVKVTE